MVNRYFYERRAVTQKHKVLGINTTCVQTRVKARVGNGVAACREQHSELSHLQLLIIAATACLAMKESVPSTDTTYATVTAVELLLVHIVIKKYAFHAGVSPKSNMTLLAMLADRLSCATQGTHKLLDQLAVQLMALFGVLQGRCV